MKIFAMQAANVGSDALLDRLTLRRHLLGQPVRLDHGRRLRKVGPHRVRTSVTREVDADEGVVSGQRVAEGSPQPGRLCEAVQQDQGRPGAAYFDMKGHFG